MIETVKVCYNKINSNKEDLEVLDKWINATRVKLKKNILIKQDKEEVNNRMYSAMHVVMHVQHVHAVPAYLITRSPELLLR